MNATKLATFAQVYEEKLREAVVNFPNEYAWPVENVPTVAARMMNAIRANNFNKDSRAIKATCKALGIKPFTYKAITAYLEGA